MCCRDSRVLLAVLAVVGLGLACSFLPTFAQEKAVERVYEMRTYTTHPGRLPALNKRFRDHTMKLFEKHGMKNESYYVPTDPQLAENTLIYIISHDSEDAAKKSWDAFKADPEWIKAKEASEADGKIVLKAEAVFMKKTDYSK